MWRGVSNNWQHEEEKKTQEYFHQLKVKTMVQGISNHFIPTLKAQNIEYTGKRRNAIKNTDAMEEGW